MRWKASTQRFISIHALREEGDTRTPRRAAQTWNFYPRPPRGGRLFDVLVLILHGEISIHALREEGDAESLRGRSKCQNFYPRPPRGGRQASHKSAPYPLVFLSTPSARRATFQMNLPSRVGRNFYPRPPRGGRPHRGKKQVGQRCDFYPRPPRGGRRRDGRRHPRPPRGGRRCFQWPQAKPAEFLSTPSARRATNIDVWVSVYWDISIHALREEGDRRSYGNNRYIYSFLSTPSARRATKLALSMESMVKISIHALREEGDWLRCSCRRSSAEFLSTPSARRATFCLHSSLPARADFYPRPPRGGRPEVDRQHRHREKISIHALREEGDVF